MGTEADEGSSLKQDPPLGLISVSEFNIPLSISKQHFDKNVIVIISFHNYLPFTPAPLDVTKHYVK